MFSACLDVEYTQSKESANYALVREGDTLYIFFECSNGGADWSVNLDFPAMPYKRMGATVWYAHRGFLEIWKRTQPYIEKHVADKSLKSIVITGYSHGAAVAVLCHEYVWFNRPDLRDTLIGYGFGCPRVLWGIQRESIKKRWESFTVVRNIDDAVTHLPPGALGYYHVGKLLEIGARGKYSPTDAHRPQNILTELKALSDNT